MSRAKTTDFFYGYVIVAAAVMISIVGWVLFNVYSVFFEPMLTEFGWSRTVTSGAYSLFIAIQGPLSIVLGRLNDKVGPRVIMIVCGFSFSLGYFLMSRITQVWELYLFLGVLAGGGMTAVWVPLLSTVARWFVKRRAMMCGLVTAGIQVSMATMPLLASWLISIYGWRNSYVIFAALTLVVFLGGGMFLKRDPGQIGQPAYGEDEAGGEVMNSGVHGLSLAEALQTRQLWMFTFTSTTITMVSVLIMVHIVIFAIDFGVPAMGAASVLAVSGISGIPGAILLGHVADRIGNRRTLVIIAVLFLVTPLWAMITSELWMFYLFAAIFGVAFAGYFTIQSPMVAELFGLRSHGVTFGLIYSITMIGGAFGPLLAGYVFDVTGSYQLAFLLSAVLGLVGLILALLLKPVPRQKHQRLSSE
ncbi:MAG: MFS transporter [Chloroflexi bacterium]|nr:MFS transporter [Chloroflexota bacterium]